ncbi:uncharacterized protein LOC6494909 isoform X3 [Drosophila ananassae]|uniref:uncharacterized protein LOC6494909 isoform X3 n=1 Tax=Drosophila ananassae TaxID=7217 RepID=UPI001CFF965D|nr:uncharacterized protein LOC6494909 isoform X3 [Drosophila ananassae]
MNLFVVLVVVSMFSNLIQAAPSVDISNDELMDGKYLCEGIGRQLHNRVPNISALKLFGNGNNDKFRTSGFTHESVSVKEPEF